MARRDVTFTGSLSSWYGAADLRKAPHPWRQRADKQVREHSIPEEEQDRTPMRLDLCSLGLDRTTIDDYTPDHEARAVVDRFVEARHLDHAGIDRVLQALDRTRYDRASEDSVPFGDD